MKKNYFFTMLAVVLLAVTGVRAQDKAASVNMPYVIERWPGGMLTNFPTIRKACLLYTSRCV